MLRATLAAMLLAAPLGAQELSLSQISDYLDGFRTAQGGFTQINADGTIGTGTITIKRPGRIRFEYAPPDRSLFLAGGGQVAIFDAGSNESPERFPLNQTPLSIILADDVDLTRSGMVTARTSDGTTTTVRAQDPERPEIGSMDLVFTADPIELRQWVVTDAAGTQTTVVLNDVETGGSVPDRLFNIQAEMAAWGN